MSKFIKKYGIGLLALIAFIGLIGLKPFQKEEKGRSDALTIGLQSEYPPFEYKNKEGELIGFDIDLAHCLANVMGKKLIIKDMEFDGEILSLKQGKIDLIISGMNITPSREKEISMIPYHKASSMSLIFWDKIPEGVQSIDDIAQLPSPAISVGVGTVPESCMKHYPTIVTKAFQGALAPLIDVKYGKSIANLVESDVAKYLQSQHPEIKILQVPLPEDAEISSFGIGVSKENPELLECVKQALQELKSSGKLTELEDTWFKHV